MTIFTMETTQVLGDGRRKWFNFEAEQETLAAIAVDLRAGPLVVQQLFCKPVAGEPGTFEILGRRPVLITTAFVFSMTVPENRRFVEYEEAGDA